MNNGTDIKKGIKALKDMYDNLGGEKKVGFMGETVTVIGKDIEVKNASVYYNNDGTINSIINEIGNESSKNNTIVKYDYEDGKLVRKHLIDSTDGINRIRKKYENDLTKTNQFHLIFLQTNVLFYLQTS